eukprot:2823573-Pyramimonas_sp.AAC.1
MVVVHACLLREELKQVSGRRTQPYTTVSTARQAGRRMGSSLRGHETCEGMPTWAGGACGHRRQ